MLQLRCGILSQQDNMPFLFQDQHRAGEHIKPKMLDIYISVLRTDKWLKIQMQESACTGIRLYAPVHTTSKPLLLWETSSGKKIKLLPQEAHRQNKEQKHLYFARLAALTWELLFSIVQSVLHYMISETNVFVHRFSIWCVCVTVCSCHKHQGFFFFMWSKLWEKRSTVCKTRKLVLS